MQPFIYLFIFARIEVCIGEKKTQYLNRYSNLRFYNNVKEINFGTCIIWTLSEVDKKARTGFQYV